MHPCMHAQLGLTHQFKSGCKATFGLRSRASAATSQTFPHVLKQFVASFSERSTQPSTLQSAPKDWITAASQKSEIKLRLVLDQIRRNELCRRVGDERVATG